MGETKTRIWIEISMTFPARRSGGGTDDGETLLLKFKFKSTTMNQQSQKAHPSIFKTE